MLGADRRAVSHTWVFSNDIAERGTIAAIRKQETLIESKRDGQIFLTLFRIAC